MSTPTAQTKLGIAPANAIASIDGGNKRLAPAAAASRPMGRSSVRSNARRPIGASAGEKAIRVARYITPSRRRRSWLNLAGSASDAETPTNGFSKSTILILVRSCGLYTACTRPLSGLSFGGVKWAISNCSAPTATVSRLGSRPGANIACERIRKAYAQPDMFVPRAPEPKQEALL